MLAVCACVQLPAHLKLAKAECQLFSLYAVPFTGITGHSDRMMEIIRRQNPCELAEGGGLGGLVSGEDTLTPAYTIQGGLK